MTSNTVDQEPAASRLTWGQRKFLGVLGVPAFGLAFGYTVVTTYVPVLLADSGPTVTGLVIGGEGLLALLVPLLVGGWSDRTGRRMPFVLVGGVISVVALLVLPLVSGAVAAVSVVVGVFFLGYFVYYSPYYALYPDLVEPDVQGRSQGIQGALRSAGLLLALAGGAVLLNVWHALPFVVSAAVLVVSTLVLLRGVREERRQPSENGHLAGIRTGLRLLAHERPIRNWAIANACWEAAIGALRTFVVLYFTVGLGFSLTGTSAALGLVGVSAVVASPFAGKLADKFGTHAVMHVSVWAFAAGLIPALVTRNALFVAGIIPVAFAAVVLLTLPYTIIMKLMPGDEDHGAAAGLFGVSRGLGVVVGPLLGGLATQLLGEVDFLTFRDTHGYSATFAVTLLLLLLSVPFLAGSKPRT